MLTAPSYHTKIKILAGTLCATGGCLFTLGIISLAGYEFVDGVTEEMQIISGVCNILTGTCMFYSGYAMFPSSEQSVEPHSLYSYTPQNSTIQPIRLAV